MAESIPRSVQSNDPSETSRTGSQTEGCGRGFAQLTVGVGAGLLEGIEDCHDRVGAVDLGVDGGRNGHPERGAGLLAERGLVREVGGEHAVGPARLRGGVGPREQADRPDAHDRAVRQGVRLRVRTLEPCGAVLERVLCSQAISRKRAIEAPECLVQC